MPVDLLNRSNMTYSFNMLPKRETNNLAQLQHILPKTSL
jgi:hypothetical protein